MVHETASKDSQGRLSLDSSNNNASISTGGVFLFTLEACGKQGNEETYRFAGLAECFEFGATLLHVAKISLIPEKLPGRIQ